MKQQLSTSLKLFGSLSLVFVAYMYFLHGRTDDGTTAVRQAIANRIAQKRAEEHGLAFWSGVVPIPLSGRWASEYGGSCKDNYTEYFNGKSVTRSTYEENGQRKELWFRATAKFKKQRDFYVVRKRYGDGTSETNYYKLHSDVIEEYESPSSKSGNSYRRCARGDPG